MQPSDQDTEAAPSRRILAVQGLIALVAIASALVSLASLTARLLGH